MIHIFGFMKNKTKVKRGRKPVNDKKEHVPLYVPKSEIETLDGIDNVRAAAYTGIKLKVDEAKSNLTN